MPHTLDPRSETIDSADSESAAPNGAALRLGMYGDPRRIKRVFMWFAGATLVGQAAGIAIVLTELDYLFAAIVAASVPPVLATLPLIRRGRLELSAILMALTLFAMLTAVASFGLGIHHLSNFAFPVVLIIAGMVTRKRTMVVLSSIAVACVAWLVFGELLGAYAPQRLERSVPGDFLSATLVIIVTATMIRLLTETMFRNNLRLQRELGERKRAEEALRESSQLNKEVIESIHEGLIVYDRGLRYQVWNPFMEQMTGIPARDVLGALPHEILPFVEEVGMMDRLRRTLAGEIPATLEFPYSVSATGRSGWVADNSSPLRSADGRIIGVISIQSDITERKRAEAEHEKLQAQLSQAQKMESVGRLAGGVAHDFNNHLQMILGHTELAIRQLPQGTPLRDELDQIRGAAEISAHLTRQLLAFAHRQDVVPRVLELNSAVSGTMRMLGRLIGENVELVWKPGAGLRNVRIDPSQVDQILTNLAANARDAISGAGKLRIETENVVLDEAWCRTHAGSTPGSYVLLLVADTGAGMSRETLEHLFEPFFTTKGLGHGTGLGLATVYGIVKQNLGFMAVVSEPGRGTEFRIYLPTTEEAVKPAAAPVDAAHARGDETVLLVEDEQGILELARTVLSKLGYTVLAARTPRSALEVTRQHPEQIHLVLTDVVMPEMNGRELYRELTALRPGIKALFMSGYTADFISRGGVVEEDLPFLQKPFSTQALSSAVRAALDRP